MQKEFAKKAFFVAGIVVGLLIIWVGRRVLLLGFTGLLLALALTSLVNFTRRWLRLPRKWAYTLVLVSLLALLGLGGWLLVPTLSDQFATLAEELPRQIQRMRSEIEDSRLVQSVMKLFPEGGGNLQQPSAAISGASAILKAVSEALSGIVVALFVGIFLAANPEMYRRGFLRLIPKPARDRAREVISRVICTLKYWLLGQLTAMAAVGLIVGVSLLIVGVPLAVPLGIVAAALEFIPFVGPLAAAVPAVLLATSMGAQTAWIVVGIFAVVQMLEGNLITPLVQHKVVELPPVVTLLVMALFAPTFGILGLFVATPFAAMMMVLVQELYVKDTLKDPMET